LTFKEHITQATEKCGKIIFALSKSAKLNWGLGHKVLKTLYTGGIQPLLIYGAPVWAETIEKKLQEKIYQSTKANQHNDSKSLQNSIKRCTVHNHGNYAHSH